VVRKQTLIIKLLICILFLFSAGLSFSTQECGEYESSKEKFKTSFGKNCFHDFSTEVEIIEYADYANKIGFDAMYIEILYLAHNRRSSTASFLLGKLFFEMSRTETDEDERLYKLAKGISFLGYSIRRGSNPGKEYYRVNVCNSNSLKYAGIDQFCTD